MTVLNKINELANAANSKGFFNTQSALTKFHAELTAKPESAYVQPIIIAALNHIAEKMQLSAVNDEQVYNETQQIIHLLNDTQMLMEQAEQLRQQNTLNAEQLARFQELFVEYQRIRNLAAQNQALHLAELNTFNQNLARTIQRNFNVVPQQQAAPILTAAAKTPATDDRAKGWISRFLDTLLSGFKKFNSAGSAADKQSAFTGVIGMFVNFFVQLIGDFFKTFLGPSSQGKVDELVQQVEPIMTKLMMPSPLAKSASAPQTPAPVMFSQQAQHAATATMPSATASPQPGATIPPVGPAGQPATTDPVEQLVHSMMRI